MKKVLASRSRVIIVFLLLWFILIVSNYLLHHPFTILALVDNPYLSTILLILILHSGVYYILNQGWVKIRGWMIYCWLLVLMSIIFHSYFSKGGVYVNSPISHQSYFLINHLLIHLGTVYVLLTSYLVGKSLAFHRIGMLLNDRGGTPVYIGVGMIAITFTLFVLGLLGWLSFWILFLPSTAIILIKYKEVLGLFNQFLFGRIESKKVNLLSYLLISVLLVFISINLIGSYKYFPIGFDGTSLYQNTTNLIYHNGGLISGGYAHNWSLFESYAAFLWGDMKYAIFLSHFMGIMVLMMLYQIGALFLKPTFRWLALTIFYTLPALTFHNFIDAKVDLAFLFISLIAIYLGIKTTQILQSQKDDSFLKKHKSVFLIIGLIMGFAMGIKYLAIMLMVGLVIALIYQFFGFGGVWSLLLLSIGALFLVGADSFGVSFITKSHRYILALFFVISGVSIFYFYWKKDSYKSFLLPASIISLLFIGVSIGFSPWLIKNMVESRSVSIKYLLNGKSDKENLDFNFRWLRDNNIPFNFTENEKVQLAEFTGLNPDDAQLTSLEYLSTLDKPTLRQLNRAKRKKGAKQVKSQKKEEIQRYLGYEAYFMRLLSLPVDITFNSNVVNLRSIDFGFLFLLILPILLVFSKSQNKGLFIVSVLTIVFFLTWLSILYSRGELLNTKAYLNLFNYPGELKTFRTWASIQYGLQGSAAHLFKPAYYILSLIPYIISVAALMCLAFLSSMLFKDFWSQIPRYLKLVCLVAFGYFLLWWIFGSGITYYALPSIALACLVIGYIFQHRSVFLGSHKVLNNVYSGGVGLLILINTLVHFTSHDNSSSQRSNLFFTPFVFQSSTSFNNTDLVKNINPALHQAIESINNDPESKVFRAGTFIEYHIDNNNTRVYEDNQLGLFNVAFKRLVNPEDLFIYLKQKNFKYLVLDLSLTGIDNTPNKSLTQKAQNLANILNNTNKVKLLVTDRVVLRTDPNTGRKTQVNELAGEIVYSGSLAIFEII